MKSPILLFVLLCSLNFGYAQEKTTSLSNQEVQVKVYPNPVQNQLHFTSENPVEQVCLYNSNGDLVYQLHPTNNEISVAEIPSGFYLFCAYTEGKRVKKGILKKI